MTGTIDLQTIRNALGAPEAAGVDQVIAEITRLRSLERTLVAGGEHACRAYASGLLDFRAYLANLARDETSPTTADVLRWLACIEHDVQDAVSRASAPLGPSHPQERAL